jgi:hypothetical protein
MQIQDLLIRPGTTPAESPPSPVRIKELLPPTGVSIGPPGAEDKVEISPLANVVLQANNHLAESEEDRVERLHASYARGHWQADAQLTAASLVSRMLAEGREGAAMAGAGSQEWRP